MKESDLLNLIDKSFNWFNEPFEIKCEVRRQESRHISIDLYMSLEQSDELINCIENSGEVSNAVLRVLSESIRKGDLQTTENQPFDNNNDFTKRWNDYFLNQ